MKTSRLAAVMALGLSAAVLAGCSQSATPDASGDPDEPANITFLTFTSPALTEEFWEEQVAAIEEEYPNLDVEIQYTPGLDRQGYAKQLLATGNLPDVIWDAPLQEFAEAGAILPYSDEDLAGIDADASALAIDDKYYGITVGAQVIPMLYFNEDKLNELGIEPPSTFDELLDAAETAKAAGEVPFLVGGGADPWASTLLLDGIITADVYGQDPEWMEKRKAGEVSFQDDLFASAVDKWASLIQSGYINSDALTVDYAQLLAKFQNGEGVFYPMGSWAGAVQTDFSAGVVPFPTDSGDTVLGVNFGQALAVSATSEFPEQAQAFAVALATGEGAITAQLESDSLIPVASDYEVPADVAPLIAQTVDAYSTADATRVLPFGWEQGGAALPSGFADQFNVAAQRVIGGGSVDDFLVEIDRQFDELNAQ
ncbi:ABC transporter substrate-binding protein [Microbacterium sp. NPDC057407]|uniref:ABC transporter substrate-binding protein n=1 Tax=Microbacterium sp. NPDC057407 TaxID=3346120 RepID=UPI003670F8C0